MALQKLLFVPDAHFPYHDRKAWHLLLEVGRMFKPHTIIVMGDFFDMYAISFHNRSPARTKNLLEEISQGKQGLKELCQLGAKKKIFLAGNHEYRLERYLSQKAPELFDVVRLEKILELKENGFEYVPYGEYVQLGKLVVTHDLDRCSKSAVEYAMDDVQGNVVIGHTHRLSYVVRGSVKRKPHVGAVFGWLGESKSIDYKNRLRCERDFVLGCGVGYLNPKTGYVYLTPIPFVDYSCILEGKLII